MVSNRNESQNILTETHCLLTMIILLYLVISSVNKLESLWHSSVLSNSNSITRETVVKICIR